MGKRGPPPVPANIVRLRGNPGRLTKAEIAARVAAGLPLPAQPLISCPRHLTGEARREWHRLRRLLTARGTPPTALDRGLLSMLCSSWSHWVEAQQLLAAMTPEERVDPRTNRIHPAYTVARRAAAQVVSLSRLFNLTPTCRGAVLIDPPPPAGPRPARGSGWDQFR